MWLMAIAIAGVGGKCQSSPLTRVNPLHDSATFIAFIHKMLGGSMWRRAGRIALAVVLAPLAIIPAAFIHTLLFGVVFKHAFSEVGMNAGMFAAVGIPTAYPVVLLVGVPVHLVLSRTRFHSVASHAAAGGVSGLGAGLLVFGLGESDDAVVSVVYGTLFILCGAAVAAAFRIVAGGPAGRTAAAVA